MHHPHKSIPFYSNCQNQEISKHDMGKIRLKSRRRQDQGLKWARVTIAILSTIGEAPLNTLTGSLPVDGTTAKNVLSEINREVQSAGWHFNSHYSL